MDVNIENQVHSPNQPITVEAQKPASPPPIINQKDFLLIILGILFLLIGGGSYYVLSQRVMQQQKTEPKSDNNSSSISVQPASQPPVSQEAVNQASNQKTPVTSPDKYGFTKLIELKGIGVKAKFPQNVTVSLQEENFYVIKASESDAVTLALKNYDGGGRRAWFQKEYPWAKNYVMEPFTGTGHSGYIAYATRPEDRPGAFFYFAVINNKMLVVSGNNYISNNVNPTLGNTSVFFTTDIQKFKSFLSTIELISNQTVPLETYPQISNLYRWSATRKTVWEDATLGFKITTPEWTESRYTKDRDSNGKFTYTDWLRTYPIAKTYDSSYFSESIKRVEVTAGYVSSQYLSVLSAKYQGKSFTDVANELLFPAGFCTTEWKSSKAECASSYLCYTRDEVAQNLIVKKQVKIGTLDAQLRSMNQDFSNKNDCRAEDTWLIKSKNGQFILSNITPDGEPIRIEAL